MNRSEEAVSAEHLAMLEDENRKPIVFGILPTYRRQDLLLDTLRKTMAQTRKPDCLVIVDNESHSQTAEIVTTYRKEFPETPVLFLDAGENLGSAGGWALGMKEALKYARNQDWFLTLDDDDPPLKVTDLEKMYAFALEQSRRVENLAAVGIVGARFNWSTGYLVRLKDDQLHGPVDVDYVGSGHMAMYSAGVMRSQGVFLGDLFFGHTEIEYSLRLRAAGFRVVAHGDLWKERRVEGNRIGLTLRPNRKCEIKWKKYYVTRNYIYTMRQHGRYDLAVKRAFIQTIAKPAYTAMTSPLLAVRGFRLGLKASIDGFLGNMGRTVDPATFNL